ncbi:MAG: asparagine synthase-related protein [Desulfovibrio sp.]
MHTVSAKDQAVEEFVRMGHWLGQKGPVAVLLSGGVDSSLLMALCGENCQEAFGVTAVSEFFTTQALEQVRIVCQELSVLHYEVPVSALAQYSISKNDSSRCYHCKKMIISNVRALFQSTLSRCKISALTFVDGTNADDDPNRPGGMALREEGVLSPFLEFGISKEMIRKEALRRGLSCAERPADSCLATRICTGQSIDIESLQHVEKIEKYMQGHGVIDCRAKLCEYKVSLLCAPEYWDTLNECLSGVADLVNSFGLQVNSCIKYGENNGS